MLVGDVDRCIVLLWINWMCYVMFCFAKFCLVPCDPDMSLIGIVCCPLCFFYASRISIRFIRPLIYLVCFKTEEDTSTRRIT